MIKAIHDKNIFYELTILNNMTRERFQNGMGCERVRQGLMTRANWLNDGNLNSNEFENVEVMC